MGRYPFGIPNSWFHVSFSEELPAGEVKPIHYMGEDMVLFRTESGVAYVLDASTPNPPVTMADLELRRAVTGFLPCQKT